MNIEKIMITSKEKTLSKINKDVNKETQILNHVQAILEDAEQDDFKLLKDCGLNNALEHFESKKISIQHNLATIDKLNNPRIFTIEEIKSVAIKYGLRFLPTEYFKGALPPELPQKIKEFKSLGLKQHSNRNRYYGANEESYFILAPKSQFELQEKPKDPLLFAKLEDGSYYLIHKWGNDLSIWNYIKNIPKRNSVNTFIGIIVTLLLLNIIINIYSELSTPSFIALTVAPFLAYTFITLFILNCNADRFNEEVWDKKFKD